MDQDFYRGASDEAALITKFVERSAPYNAALEHAARTSNVHMIRINGDEPPDTGCTRILNAITQQRSTVSSTGAGSLPRSASEAAPSERNQRHHDGPQDDHCHKHCGKRQVNRDGPEPRRLQHPPDRADHGLSDAMGDPACLVETAAAAHRGQHADPVDHHAGNEHELEQQENDSKQACDHRTLLPTSPSLRRPAEKGLSASPLCPAGRVRDRAARNLTETGSQRRLSNASLRSGVVNETTSSEAVKTGRMLLSKVPEVTVWFWVIKILCTTVGESFADWINMTLGVGLIPTALIFTVVLAAVLGWQLSLNRYVPFVYWLTVVVLSVTGTLYTDILTDNLGVPLALSTSVFAASLALVFGVWYARERTLSIHSIVTRPRELFYWLAVLVTFALGTAAGDWILELTGWGPGTSVLLPAGLIVAVVIGWGLGANAVLSFWLAYILTRPLGANLGDWLGLPQDQRGLGLGVALTSAIFLTAILAIVLYLTRTRTDVI